MYFDVRDASFSALSIASSKYYPIQIYSIEMGQFDTQVLKAIEKGEPIPEGVDCQHGERYGIATLREAVFSRDNYTCKCCGKSVKDGVILHVHHIKYRSQGGTNRMDNLATVCHTCHSLLIRKESQMGFFFGCKKTKMKRNWYDIEYKKGEITMIYNENFENDDCDEFGCGTYEVCVKEEETYTVHAVNKEEAIALAIDQFCDDDEYYGSELTEDVTADDCEVVWYEVD